MNLQLRCLVKNYGFAPVRIYRMSYVAVRILKERQNLKLRKNEFLVEFDSAELDWVFFENLKEAPMVYDAWLKDRRESQDPADKYTL